MSVTMLKMGTGSRFVGAEGHDLSVALGTAHHLASSGTRQCIRNGEPHPTSTIVKIGYFEGHVRKYVREARRFPGRSRAEIVQRTHSAATSDKS